MYKAIKDNKIIAICENDYFPCLIYDEVEEDNEHTCDDYKCYGDEFTLHNIEKDNEEAKQARVNAYTHEVDPIMSEYNRKKTFNLFDEGEEEKLLAEIEAKVADIKARYPYIEGE